MARQGGITSEASLESVSNAKGQKYRQPTQQLQAPIQAVAAEQTQQNRLNAAAPLLEGQQVADERAESGPILPKYPKYLNILSLFLFAH